MKPRFIRIRELATVPALDGMPDRPGLLPVSPATIWRWVKRGQFPAPVRLGPQITAWSVEAVEAWQRQRINGAAE